MRLSVLFLIRCISLYFIFLCACSFARSPKATGTVCGSSFSKCYLPRHCNVQGTCSGAPSTETICSPIFERCNHTLGCLPNPDAPHTCLRSVDTVNPSLRQFGCRIGSACLPFGQQQSSSNPCRTSSRPAVNDSQQCTGNWYDARGQGVCDCAGQQFTTQVEDGKKQHATVTCSLLIALDHRSVRLTLFAFAFLPACVSLPLSSNVFGSGY